MNSDYNQGLELLLARLAQLRLTILGIAVDSSVARELAPDDRELALDFPIGLRPGMNTYDLRLKISRAQKPIARRTNVKPGSDGNSQRRIRITLTGDDPLMTYDHLIDQLVGRDRDIDIGSGLTPSGSKSHRSVASPSSSSAAESAALALGGTEVVKA